MFFVKKQAFYFSYSLVNQICPLLMEFTELTCSCKHVKKINQHLWIRSAVVMTTSKLHSTKSKLRFCAGSNLARTLTEICDGENRDSDLGWK